MRPALYYIYMLISPFIFLILYVAGVLIFLVLGLVNIYHVIRFSHLRAPSIIMSLFFLIATAGVVLGTFLLLQDIVWDQTLEIALPFTNTFDEGF